MENSHGNSAVKLAIGNDIIFAARPKRMQTVICKKTVTTEISEDFILPDYQPQIRRLLHVTPMTSIPSHYISRSMAEFSGNVNWSVLYITEDGKIAEAKLVSPYDAAVDFETEYEVAADSFASDEICIDGVVARVTAPRKLSLRAKLKHCIRVCGERETETDLLGEVSPASVKRLTRTLPVNYAVGGIDDSVELEDSFQLPADCKVIGTTANVIASNCEADPSGIVCRGSVCLKLIYLDVKDQPTVLEHRIPFTAHVVCPLDGDGWNCRAYGKLIDVSTDTVETDVLCRIRLAVSAEAQKNLPIQLISDIFSTEKSCKKELESLTLPCSLLCLNQSFSHDGSAVIDGLPADAHVVDASCVAEAEGITHEKNRYVLSGKCKYSTLFSTDGDYSVRETELPFRCEIDSGVATPTDLSAIISVSSCRVRPEGENYAFSADMNLSLRLCGESAISSVCSAKFEEDVERRNAAFTVAYISPADSLWDIAKKYCADPTALAEANDIKVSDISSHESLSGVKYLIV